MNDSDHTAARVRARRNRTNHPSSHGCDRMIDHRTRLLAAAYFALPLCLLLTCVARAQTPDTAPRGDLTKARAHWLTRDTIAWPGAGGAANAYRLCFDPAGALRLTPGGITGGASIAFRYDPARLCA